MALSMKQQAGLLKLSGMLHCDVKCPQFPSALWKDYQGLCEHTPLQLLGVCQKRKEGEPQSAFITTSIQNKWMSHLFTSWPFLLIFNLCVLGFFFKILVLHFNPTGHNIFFYRMWDRKRFEEHSSGIGCQWWVFATPVSVMVCHRVLCLVQW